jgi:hypothetical protein
MKKRFFVPAWHCLLLLCLPLLFASSCGLLDPDPNDGIAYCTSDVIQHKDFVITQNQLNINTYSFDGDHITFEYSNYQNQICPSRTTTVSCDIRVSSEQTIGVGVSLWIEWGPDPLQRIEKNYMFATLSQDLSTNMYQQTVTFTPGEWVTMNDAAIVTTKVHFTFKSPNHNPNSDIVYLSNIFRSLTVTTSYYSY